MLRMEQQALKIVNNCLNTNICSYLETFGGQSCNLYLNVVHFFNTKYNLISVAAQDTCFPALVSNIRCSIEAYLMIEDYNSRIVKMFKKQATADWSLSCTTSQCSLQWCCPC